MCRLLGVVAAGAAPITDLVPEELPRLEALSAEHSHGWGVASAADHPHPEPRPGRPLRGRVDHPVSSLRPSYLRPAM